MPSFVIYLQTIRKNLSYPFLHGETAKFHQYDNAILLDTVVIMVKLNALKIKILKI